MELIGNTKTETDPPLKGHIGGSCYIFISEQKSTLRCGATRMTLVHFLSIPSGNLTIFFFFFCFKKNIAQSFSVLGHISVNTRVCVSLRYDENKQTLYIQRCLHYFIEIGSQLTPLPMTHNCIAFPKIRNHLSQSFL